MNKIISTTSYAVALCCFLAAACLASPVLLAVGAANLMNAATFGGGEGD